MLIASLKMIAFVLTVTFYLVTSAIFYPLTLVNPFKGRQILSFIISFYSKIGLAFMGIKINEHNLKDISGAFIVCNHLSYLDILIISSRLPSCFVTSLEIKRTPFLGQLCEMGGCLYVDRKSRENLSKEVEMITYALKEGLNVCVFPEGTSTNGANVLRFKRPLFKASVDADVKVVALCLNYRKLNSEKISIKNRDSLFWYGDMSFLPHLWNFFKQRSVVVDLEIVGNIEGERDYVKLSEETYEKVSRHFTFINESLC